MNNPMRKNIAKIEKLANDDWEERSQEERRSENDNRSGRDKSYFEKGGEERRLAKERRQPEERRASRDCIEDGREDPEGQRHH